LDKFWLESGIVAYVIPSLVNVKGIGERIGTSLIAWAMRGVVLLKQSEREYPKSEWAIR
jgi:hypothetical protein